MSSKRALDTSDATHTTTATTTDDGAASTQAEKRVKIDAADEAAAGDTNARDIMAPSLHPCTHEVCLPKDYKAVENDAIFNPPLPAKLVREYPFVLDSFQRKAIGCLERRESVLVAAHTSAGKTVCAEYVTFLSACVCGCVSGGVVAICCFVFLFCRVVCAEPRLVFAHYIY
jgi:superfamily II RNA helicase